MVQICMIYAVGTWTKQREICCICMKITWKERESNEWVRSRNGLEDIAAIANPRNLNWPGHIARTGEGGWTEEFLQWY